MWLGRGRRILVLAAVSLLAPVEVSHTGPPPHVPYRQIPSDAALQEAADSAQALPRLHSLLVSRGGELVLERYYGGARAGRPANVKSVSKSVISALTGIAIERGLIASVHAPISEFFPQHLGEDAGALKRSITVEDLLTMRSGLESTSGRNFGVWVSSRSWVRHALTRPMIRPPGTQVDYSTGNSHLLSAILTKAAGVSTWAFAQEALAGPLGFTLAKWPRDPEGIYRGGNDMEMTPRQMLAFGQLYLDRGRAGGRQVIPEEWIEASFIPRGRSRWSGRSYGYGWWLKDAGGRGIRYAWGYGGQFIVIAPDLELVIVTTSASEPGIERRGHRRAVDELIDSLLI